MRFEGEVNLACSGGWGSTQGGVGVVMVHGHGGGGDLMSRKHVKHSQVQKGGLFVF